MVDVDGAQHRFLPLQKALLYLPIYEDVRTYLPVYLTVSPYICSTDFFRFSRRSCFACFSASLSASRGPAARYGEMWGRLGGENGRDMGEIWVEMYGCG